MHAYRETCIDNMPGGLTAAFHASAFHLVLSWHRALTLNININLQISINDYIYKRKGKEQKHSCQAALVIGDILKHKDHGIKALSLDYH